MATANISLPEGEASVELQSDTWVPRETLEGSRDPRKLGVAVTELRLLDEAPPP